MVFLALHFFVKPIAYSISADTNVLSGMTSGKLGDEDMRWDFGEASLCVAEAKRPLPNWLSDEAPPSEFCDEENLLLAADVVFPGPGVDFEIERRGSELRIQLRLGRGAAPGQPTAHVGLRTADGKHPVRGRVIVRVDLGAPDNLPIHLDLEVVRLLLGRDPNPDRTYGGGALLMRGAVSGFVGVRLPFLDSHQLPTYRALDEKLDFRDAVELSSPAGCYRSAATCNPIHASAVIDPATESVSGKVIHAHAVTPEPKLNIKRPHFSKGVTIDLVWHEKLGAIPGLEIIISVTAFLIGIIDLFLRKAE
ncbi:MAG: hypothetical protein ACR2RF_07225 [Geminicoccaceae bacterium]